MRVCGRRATKDISGVLGLDDLELIVTAVLKYEPSA